MILLLCCAGQSQEFFGVMDSYGLATAGQVWTLAAIATPLRAGAERDGPPSAVKALAACAFTTASFVATLFRWSAVLLAALIRKCPLLRPAPILATLAPLLLAAALIHLFGRSGWTYQLELFGGADKSAWVPPRDTVDLAGTHFTMFSWGHVAARLNLLCLSTPAWLPLGLVALACTQAPRAIDAPATRLLLILGLAALSGLSRFLLVHPDLGPPTDWMQTASGAFAPYVSLIAFCLSRLTEATAARVGTMCIGLSLLHTVPAVLTHAGVIGW